ncbi:hypothetical protein BJY00DRAFT_179423 [Aspergillus carlsbadensis]|nr:hypothetical protein BJY00DRAFT_179423 [Aspergillus carlsbadensis]
MIDAFLSLLIVPGYPLLPSIVRVIEARGSVKRVRRGAVTYVSPGLVKDWLSGINV